MNRDPLHPEPTNPKRTNSKRINPAPSVPGIEPGPQTQALQEQQILLFWLLTKILRRLAREIEWTRVGSYHRRRVNAALEMLEGDVQLVRIVTAPKTVKRPRRVASQRAAAPAHVSKDRCESVSRTTAKAAFPRDTSRTE